ncbi:MAG: PIG-L family deacetylase [Candidatus Bathyarchaeota archaeon]|nr:PIG-L family deacetylase [Candidatus Bathyarchaeota archaeon]
MAVGCHPDDVESGCFGTLALYRKRNVDVTVLLLTGGERGGEKAERLRAAESACSLIGASLVYADFEDGKLTDDVDSVSWIEREFRKVRADIVFVPSPHDRHQDHRNGGNAGISAGRTVSNVLLYETPTTVEFKPQIYVDIDATLAEKIKAMSFHKSADEVEFVSEAIRCLAKYRAYQLIRERRHVEAFQVVKWKLDPLGTL